MKICEIVAGDARPSRPSLFEEEGGGRANPGGAPTRQLLNFPYTNPFGGGQTNDWDGQLSNAKEFGGAYPWTGYQSSTWDGNMTVLPVMSPGGGAAWGQNYSNNSSFPWFRQNGTNGTNGSMWIGVPVQTPTWIRGTAMVESDAEDQTSTVMMKAANCTNVAALFYCPFAIDGVGRISRTPQGGFGYPPCGDPGCAYISLARLNITSVDRDTFKDMALLEILDLGHNALTSVDDGAFRSTPRLKRLSLKGHSLPVIRNGMFSGRLSNLMLLDLSYCQVPYSPSPSGGMHIEPGAFLDLTGLEVLNLYASQLTDESLATGIFRRCSRLSRLDLSYNRLTIVNDATLAGLSKSLVSLGLDGNKIACISKGAFAGFTRLVQVGLAKNSLTVLPSKVFDDVGKAVHPSSRSGGGKPPNEGYGDQSGPISLYEHTITSPDDWDPQFEVAPYMPESFRSNSSISEGYFDPLLDTKETTIYGPYDRMRWVGYPRSENGRYRCCDGSTSSTSYFSFGNEICYGRGGPPGNYRHNYYYVDYYYDSNSYYYYNGFCGATYYYGTATPGTFSGRKIPQYHFDTDMTFTSADGKDQMLRKDKGHPSFSWGVINLAGNSLECRLAQHSWLEINTESDHSFDPYTLPPCPEEVRRVRNLPPAPPLSIAWRLTHHRPPFQSLSLQVCPSSCLS